MKIGLVSGYWKFKLLLLILLGACGRSYASSTGPFSLRASSNTLLRRVLDKHFMIHAPTSNA
jgi:hypothetical protein